MNKQKHPMWLRWLVAYVVLAAVVGVAVLLTSSLFKPREDAPRATQQQNPQPPLPNGWTLDSYRVEKVMPTACERHEECETPMEYLIRSSCPFTSLCLENKCTVVCPQPN